MKRFALATVALFAAASLLAQTSGQNSATNYTSSLTGSGIPGSGGSGSGFGFANLSLNGNQSTLTSSTLGLNGITGISLYSGSAGSNGQFVQSFTDATNSYQNGSFSRTMTIDATLASQIAANPQNYYFLINSSDFPNGAVRGQLTGNNTQNFSGTLSGSGLAGGSSNGSGFYTTSLTPNAGGQTYTLNYDVSTSGIGNSFSSLSLGPLTGGGSALATFGNNSTATNGRLTGSTTLTSAQAQQFMSNPSSFGLRVNTSAFPNGAVGGANGSANETFIAVAGSVNGVNNSHYATDLSMFNNGQGSNGATTASMEWYPSGSTSGSATNTSSTTLPPQGTRNWTDVSSTGFSTPVTGIGAMRIVSSGSIFANARIYNDRSSSGGGSFGQNLTGRTRSEALQAGVLVGLSNASSSTGSGKAGSEATSSSHTNIGFFNPSSTTATVMLQLRDSNGNVTSSRMMSVGGWQQMQMSMTGANGVFNGTIGSTGGNSVNFLSSSQIFVYASVVDDVTGDGSYVEPHDSSNSSSNGSSSAGGNQ